jgi:hypothetical protein
MRVARDVERVQDRAAPSSTLAWRTPCSVWSVMIFASNTSL